MGMRFGVYSASADEAQRLRGSRAAVTKYFDTIDRWSSGCWLEKSWHGLHYVFAGDAWGGEGPMAFLLGGGDPVGGDLGYGPARLIAADEVPGIANALGGLTDEEFDRRFDLERLAEEQIYPEIWDEGRDELLDEYRGYFHQLREFTREAAREGKALVLVLS